MGIFDKAKEKNHPPENSREIPGKHPGTPGKGAFTNVFNQRSGSKNINSLAKDQTRLEFGDT